MKQDFAARLTAYARLIIRAGCNLQPGQELLLSASTDCVEFARLLVAEAYQQGARHVTVRFGDEKIARLHYENCALEVFEHFPEWQALLNNSLAREGAAVLSIISEDPLALTGVDQRKLVANARASHEACKEFYDGIDQGRVVWCIAGAAAPAWAQHVFPTLSPEEATAKLWEAIFNTTRVNEPDPVAAWQEHRASFDARKAWLNAQHFDALHYTNSLGTDLTIGLNTKGLWQGGGDVTTAGTEFFPNMPTEEIFTTPDRLRAEGIVYSSMPLVHHGSLIQDFWLRFEGGRVTEYHARTGNDVLEAIFAVDEDAVRLGECALVPWTSPIRQSGILFYNTLYDENASCHLAVGQGFPDCLEGGQAMDAEELKAAGVNKSATHVDFMIGSADLNITGVKADGASIPVFRDGEWAFAPIDA
ncbi:MAG: aminopeptidase [Coriobacteriales bacterium]|jgi:aminopeptidase|nr:aminopeptidase [Coriobacteriales bacterium]